MPRLLPLFPLQMVALPGAAIPLHIFEERYREMVGEAEAAGSEFGIVLVQDEGVVNAGCTVTVESVLARYPDGRFDVMTLGRRRFLLTSLDREKPYLRGEVDFFDDDDWTAVPPEVRDEALRMWRLIGIPGEEPDAAHPLLSFQLAHGVDDLNFKNLLLRTRSEGERLRDFIQFARAYLPRRQYVEHMKAVAPTNGSGHKPSGV